MATTSGVFPTNPNHTPNEPPNAVHDTTPPFVLEFNWVSAKEDFDKPQYEYLTNTVFENYSMHLLSRRQSGVDREHFGKCMRLLYTQMPEEVTDTPGASDTASSTSYDTSDSMSVTSESSLNANNDLHFRGSLANTSTQQELVKKSNLHLNPTQVLADLENTEYPATNRESTYRQQQTELQLLVSSLLYLTEMYGVAQTRGGAQVSQYRRTLTAQSHAMLVERLSRMLQHTEAGFWAWLEQHDA